MKKTYFSPETNLLLIATQKMIAVSDFKSQLDEEDVINDPEDMLARKRRRTVWDDEEEEEEFDELDY